MKTRTMWGIAGVGVVVVAAAVLFLVSGGTAGDYHSGSTLICSDCHVMHAQTSHTYGGGVTSTTYTPTAYLLKGADVCLVCHDGQGFAPDVVEVREAGAGVVRQAGALNKTTSVGDYAPYKGHTLGSTATAPGGTFAAASGLNCTDCHHQHGFAGSSVTDVAGNAVTSAWRNLRAMSVGGSNKNVSYNDAGGANVLTKDIYQGGGSSHYDVSNVWFNEPAADNSGMGTWCKGCHVDFHGKAGDANMGGTGTPPAEWKRHPAAQSNIGALTGGHSSLATFSGTLYRVKVMSPTGVWGADGAAWAGAPTDLSPTCISCHKGHGSKRPFGLIYALGNAPLGEDGDGTDVKHLCRQCHVQGAD